MGGEESKKYIVSKKENKMQKCKKKSKKAYRCDIDGGDKRNGEIRVRDI